MKMQDSIQENYDYSLRIFHFFASSTLRNLKYKELLLIMYFNYFSI